MKALKIKKAGTNPWLRLTLSSTPLADPEVWLIQTTVLGFRRLLRKEPILYHHWISFHRSYMGTLYCGPFFATSCLVETDWMACATPSCTGSWWLLAWPPTVAFLRVQDAFAGWMDAICCWPGNISLDNGRFEGAWHSPDFETGDSVRCSPNCFVGSYPVWYALCFSSSCKVRHVQGCPLPTLRGPRFSVPLVDLSEIFTSSYSFWCLGSCRVWCLRSSFFLPLVAFQVYCGGCFQAWVTGYTGFNYLFWIPSFQRGWSTACLHRRHSVQCWGPIPSFRCLGCDQRYHGGGGGTRACEWGFGGT